ncbi:MAG TPA: hypothetical protein VMF66_21095 [Candidatus Acidoferrum sp.]|nr:hypothetical protein [Candidatus Acidoferrum sp.]
MADFHSIHEVAKFGNLTAKFDPSDVRYYVYNPAYPKLGMCEIIWRTQTLPLPGTPPLVANDRAHTH